MQVTRQIGLSGFQLLITTAAVRELTVDVTVKILTARVNAGYRHLQRKNRPQMHTDETKNDPSIWVRAERLKLAIRVHLWPILLPRSLIAWSRLTIASGADSQSAVSAIVPTRFRSVQGMRPDVSKKSAARNLHSPDLNFHGYFDCSSSQRLAHPNGIAGYAGQ